ncbi:hypothetical protein B296_00045603, partial [Ensete ventricosum]
PSCPLCTAVAVAAALRRRRLPFANDSRPAKGRPGHERQPLACWPLSVATPTGDRPMRAAAPAGGHPFAGGPWLQSVAPL